MKGCDTRKGWDTRKGCDTMKGLGYYEGMGCDGVRLHHDILSFICLYLVCGEFRFRFSPALGLGHVQLYNY